MSKSKENENDKLKKWMNGLSENSEKTLNTIEPTDINALRFAIMCNFPDHCGSDRTSEAVELFNKIVENLDILKTENKLQKGELEQLKAKQARWISVSEGLPEPEINVLILQSFKETGPYASVTIGHLHQESDLRRKPYWSWIAYGGDMVHPKLEAYHRAEFICPGNEFVIAWQPLPEPYHIGEITKMVDSAEIRGMKND